MNQKPQPRRRAPNALGVVLATAICGFATQAQALDLNEAPILAERVAAGTLPPVDERVPRPPRVIEVAEQAAACDMSTSVFTINSRATHRRQVNLYAAVACRLPGETVAAALHGDEKTALFRKRYGSGYVGRTARLHNKCRMLVN